MKLGEAAGEIIIHFQTVDPKSLPTVLPCTKFPDDAVGFPWALLY